MKLKQAVKFLKEASKNELVELAPGTWLQSKEDIINDQEGWDDEDSCKDMDFTTHDFWITTDCGSQPTGVDCAEDLILIINN